jgi:hypothetical protein
VDEPCVFCDKAVNVPCPDCLDLAKILREAHRRIAYANDGNRNDHEWATGGDLDAFIKAREK